MLFDIKAHQQLFAKAGKSLDDSSRALGDAVKGIAELDKVNVEAGPSNNQKQNVEDGDDAADLRRLQLILQYRLSTHDALRALLQYQHSLCQLLGVSDAGSAEVNYEHLAYALGSGDLSFLLSMLNQLADALLKLMGRLEKKNEEKRRQSRKLQKKRNVLVDAQEALLLLETAQSEQESFTSGVKDLTLSLQGIAGAPESEEVLDYLGCLQGPISRFYQALHNGLVLSASLYQQYSMSNSYTPELTDIMDKLHQALDSAAPHLEPQRFFSHLKAHHVSEDNLEERADSLRMGKFFNH